jgi:predicted ATP-grasp superfamily ATP-dependent carboligase
VQRDCCVVGKAIVFARAEAEFTRRTAAWVEQLNAASPRQQAADIPRIGTRFSPGDPVLSLLVQAERPTDVRDPLMRLANALRDQLV